MKHSLSLRQRLLAYSAPASQNGCVNFTGSKTPQGYGLLQNPATRKMEYAHRISYLLEHGTLPGTHKGQPSCVLHRCDNPSCVAPAHLVLGNQKLNMQDKVGKGRSNPNKKTRGKALTDVERELIYDGFKEGISSYFIAQQMKKSASHISTLRRKWNEQQKQEAQTVFLKETNARLTKLLFPDRKAPKKPSGSDPGVQGSAVQVDAAIDALGGSNAA